jgi:hypothetical protein
MIDGMRSKVAQKRRRKNPTPNSTTNTTNMKKREKTEREEGRGGGMTRQSNRVRDREKAHTNAHNEVAHRRRPTSKYIQRQT